MEFSYANKKGPGVIDCKIECTTDDHYGNPLLLVTMMVLSIGTRSLLLAPQETCTLFSTTPPARTWLFLMI